MIEWTEVDVETRKQFDRPDQSSEAQVCDGGVHSSRSVEPGHSPQEAKMRSTKRPKMMKCVSFHACCRL